MLSVLPRQLTDEEIRQGAPLRKKAREKVEKIYTDFRDKDSKAYKLYLSDSELKPLSSFLESEIAWWNANVQLSPTQVNTRETQFEEQYPIRRQQVTDTLIQNYTKEFKEIKEDPKRKDLVKKQEEFRKAPKPGFDKAYFDANLNASLSRVSQQVTQKTPETPPEDKTTYDIVMEALAYATGFVGLIVYVCLALRFAGFAASETMWRPMPYRILSWVYTFVFMPIFFPYYIYREINGYLNPEESLKWESLFPYKAYVPEDINFSLERKLFGYTDTDQLRSWIQAKKTEQEKSWTDFLIKQASFLADFRQAKEQERVLQQQ